MRGPIAGKLEMIREAAPVLGATGVLIASAGFEADNMLLPGGEAQAATEHAQVMNRANRLSLQSILNRIHRVVIPLDQEATIRPTSAFMLRSSGGFRTDCSRGDASYVYYKVTPLGTSYEPCGRGLPYQQKSDIDQYQEPLNKIGNDIRRSVGFTAIQKTTSIRGSRSRLVSRFSCAPNGIKQVVITHKKGQRPGHNTATITPC